MTGKPSMRCAKATSATLDGKVQGHLGTHLRALYSVLMHEQLPSTLLQLVARLDGAVASSKRNDAEAFRRGLIETLPHLRAFALSLTANETRADDLVQETILKAWQYQHRFEAGSNLRAWLCTILRNQFYTEIRKRKREVEDADGAAAARLITLPDQDHVVRLKKVAIELHKLPATQREALILVGAQGMTYEDAAGVLSCAIGTVKSRVSRARTTLSETVE